LDGPIKNRRLDLVGYDQYETNTRDHQWENIFNHDFRKATDLNRKRMLNRYVDQYIDAMLAMPAIDVMRNAYADKKILKESKSTRFILAINETTDQAIKAIDGDVLADMIRQVFVLTNFQTCLRISMAYVEQWRVRLKTAFEAEYLSGKDPKIDKTVRRAKELANIVEPGRFEESEIRETDLQVTVADRDLVYALGQTNRIEKQLALGAK